MEAEESVPKKKPGRPPGRPPKQNPASPVLTGQDSQTLRRPSRIRKVPSRFEDMYVNEGLNSGDSVDDKSGSSTVRSKRRPGRPRKSSEAVETSADCTPKVEDQTGSTPPKRKPGRPRKNPDESNTSSSVLSEASVDAAAALEEGAGGDSSKTAFVNSCDHEDKVECDGPCSAESPEDLANGEIEKSPPTALETSGDLRHKCGPGRPRRSETRIGRGSSYKTPEVKRGPGRPRKNPETSTTPLTDNDERTASVDASSLTQDGSASDSQEADSLSERSVNSFSSAGPDRLGRGQGRGRGRGRGQGRGRGRGRGGRGRGRGRARGHGWSKNQGHHESDSADFDDCDEDSDEPTENDLDDDDDDGDFAPSAAATKKLKPLRHSTPVRKGRRGKGAQDNSAGAGSVSKKPAHKKKAADSSDSQAFEKCLRCEEPMENLGEYKAHLMRHHAAVYSASCPAGDESTKSINMIIAASKCVHCPQCDKPFKHYSYFKLHMKWCGRENEKQTCDLCGHTLKAMWFHIHMKAHAQKEREQEAKRQQDKDAEQAEGETQADGSRGRRKAATAALKTLKDLTKNEGSDENFKHDDKDMEWDAADKDQTHSDDDGVDDEDEDEISGNKKAGKTRISVSMIGEKRYQIPVLPSGDPADCFKEYMQRVKHLPSDNLFTHLQPSRQEWMPLSESVASRYFPATCDSLPFCVERSGQTTEPTCLRWGQSDCMEGQGTAFAGGPVWAMEWCPIGQQDSEGQVLAVATSLQMWESPELSKTHIGPGLVQFWQVGHLPSRENQSLNFRLTFTVAQDFGHVTSMVWCPRGACDADRPAEEILPRLGLLALACSDSSVRLYSIPTPEALGLVSEDEKEKSSSHVPVCFKPSPMITLNSASAKDCGPCLCVSWQKGDSCEFIAGGYGKGHQAAVLSVDWSPVVATQFTTGGWDAVVQVWDLNRPGIPIFNHKKVNRKSVSTIRDVCITPASQSSLLSAEELPYPGGITGQDMSNSVDAVGVCRTAASILTMSHTGWYDAVVCGDTAGSLHLATCSHIHVYRKSRKKDLQKQGVKLFTTLAVDLKEDSGTKKGKDWLPQTKVEAEERLCIKFKDYKYQTASALSVVKPENAKLLDPLAGFPFQDVTKVSFNPNLNWSQWVAAGTRAGFLRILHIKMLAHVSKAAKQYFASHIDH